LPEHVWKTDKQHVWKTKQHVWKTENR